MSKRALFLCGGWEGHTPRESAEVFAPLLHESDYEVEIEASLAPLADRDRLDETDLVVPVWSMGEISSEQWQALDAAVRAGTGCAGFHGGILDAFRDSLSFKWMVGGQFVAHPGNTIPEHRVEVVDREHEITKGIADFVLPDSEQYYCHVDPGVHVLCTTTFTGEHGETTLYPADTVMPYAWTRSWGTGRIFAASWGHTWKDFDVPEAREIVLRGLKWATRGE
ncbi:MAG: ThuA domain-containing protein [Phycisphaeraceae bacterium]